jgi:ribose transport system permease protein
VLADGLILMGVGDFVRQMITGGVIILAVIVDSYRARFAERTR